MFFGRRQETNSFLAVAKEGGQSSASWVGVRLLESDSLLVPVPQALVDFSNGMRWDVGGSGRSDYVMNIGDSGQTMTCEVRWPSGYVQTGILSLLKTPSATRPRAQPGLQLARIETTTRNRRHVASPALSHHGY